MARVAYVSADFGVPVFGTKGCSIHAQEVLGAMLRRGATVDLFSTSTDGVPPRALANLRVHTLPRPGKGEAAVRERAGLAVNETLRAELDKAGPFDLVYERYSLWSYTAMEFARETGIPGLLEVNAPLIEEQAKYRVLVDRAAAERVAARVFSAASALIAVSEEVGAYLGAFDSVARKVHVVPNGIDTARFPEVLTPALPAPGLFTVGFVGTLKAWHGVDVLLEAFHRFHLIEPASRLLIVGDGPERERLEALALGLGLERAAVFTGVVPAADVPGLIASMDAAVAPYPLLDHFYFSPLKVYEYMAAGKAVVASEVGQLRKLIEPGENGLLVPPGDAEALSAALRSLRNDPGLRKRIGTAARAHVLRSHTWDKIVDRVFELAGSEKSDPVPAVSAP